MGNTPSSSAPKSASASASASASSTPTPTHTRSSSSHDAGVTRTVSNKRDSRNANVMAMHPTPRVAAPPEESLAPATRSNVITHPKPLPPSVTGLGTSYSPPTVSTSASGSGISTPQHQQQQQQQSKPPDERPIPVREEPTQPVDVPSEPSSSRAHHHVFEPPPLVSNNSLTDLSYLTRPPRLPLPIEEELHTPGSPIIAPVDAGDASAADIEPLDSDAITRKSSAFSNASGDVEAEVDEEEEEDMEGLVVDKTRPTVPTRLQWLRGGDKVYVTGTIFQWNRKQKLQPIEGRPGAFETTINILPGTHHVRFLVDGIMQTSPDLPTTVDFGNNLVNYIEVSPDDVPITAGQLASKEAQEGPPAEAKGKAGEEEPKLKRGKSVLPEECYRHEIPRYLEDFDQEDSEFHQYADATIERLPRPPALPGFLSKPILNVAAPIKDDNSVLKLPNHAILNHLATKSIRDEILSVSVTTRYKNKYVTTMIYKPSPKKPQPTEGAEGAAKCENDSKA